MPVMMCAGTAGCNRMISISQVPGGNPAAKADPEGYASEWTYCVQCRSYTCDRCLGRQHGQCRCGTAARLFTEPQRISVAANLAKGLPAVAGGPAPAAGAPAAGSQPVVIKAGGAGLPPGITLRMLLDGLLKQVDQELAQKNDAKAKSLVGLAASLMEQHSGTAEKADIAWFLQFAESFYRWRYFIEGVVYLRGVYAALKRMGINMTPEGDRTVGMQGAYMMLGGDLSKYDVQTKRECTGVVKKVFGADHVLTREVLARVGDLPAAAVAPAGPQPVNLVVSIPPGAMAASASVASMDASTRLGVWVTLAFLDIAMSDGNLGDSEYMAWKNAMARMKLPDPWEKFGKAAIGDMLKKGVLQELSVDLAKQPAEVRQRLAGLLIEFMMADGKAEAHEIAALRRIGGWIGVSLQFGPA